MASSLTRRLAPALLFAGLLASGALTGCGSGERTVARVADVAAPGSAAGYNVVLVTMDTARRDRFGCYGDADARTPTVDALAATGVRFADAVTSVPLTLPSHTTLLTGLYPTSHGVHDNGVDALGPEPSTLATSLSQRGYATGAFVGAFVLDERFGLARGFDVYDFAVGSDGYRPSQPDFNERAADGVTDAALEWLNRAAGGDAPFFAWLHYFDPHLPYTSPLAGLPEFAGRPYDAEIAYADAQLKRVVDWLEVRGLRDRTLMVVTSDHGEAFGEHGEATHGMFIYEGTMAVPLVMSCPSLFSQPVVHRGGVVGLVDVRPTLEDLLGLASADAMDGQSLLNPVPADRRVYMETYGPRRMAGCAPLHGLRGGAHKFIAAPESEYYDLAADPGETENLYRRRLADLQPLQAELEVRLAGADADDAGPRTLTDEEMRRLRSLGYTVTSAAADTGSLPDPKWRIRQFNDGMEAERLYGQGDYAAAARLARQVVRSCEGCLNATRVLAFSELRLGHADTAIAVLEAAVSRQPDPYLVRSLAQAMIIDHEYAAALNVLDLYAAMAPDDGWEALLRGDVLAARGETDAALDCYRRAGDMDPHRAGPRARDRIARMQGDGR
jgi:choline-sulfatase